jgi:hypothetical protein
LVGSAARILTASGSSDPSVVASPRQVLRVADGVKGGIGCVKRLLHRLRPRHLGEQRLAHRQIRCRVGGLGEADLRTGRLPKVPHARTRAPKSRSVSRPG